MLIYSRLLAETAARRVIVSDGSLRSGALIDLAEPEAQVAAEDFEHQVLASAEALGHRFRFDRYYGRHVSLLATRLFDEMKDEHRLTSRERLLLQTASLLHDVGIHVSLRSHHKHSQYLLWPRRSSGYPRTKPQSSPTSPATIAAICPSGATCRTSNSTSTSACL